MTIIQRCFIIAVIFPLLSFADDYHQWADYAKASSQRGTGIHDWLAIQSTGISDVSGYGDNADAWAPYSNGSGSEWLQTHYERSVFASQVRVHETYNNGFIYQVDLIDSAGSSHTIWSGTDTTPRQPDAWFEISFTKTTYQVNGVKLFTQVSGYEEVDAVELIGEIPASGTLNRWAASASASSNYNINTPTKATGAPDVASYIDSASAWAPSTNGSGGEWLRLNYTTPVYATQLRVRESYNNGSIYQIDLIDAEGAFHTIWSGVDMTPKKQAWFDIGFEKTTYPVNGIKIYTQLAGWEEIDAAELIGDTTQDSSSTPTPTPTITPTPSPTNTLTPTTGPIATHTPAPWDVINIAGNGEGAGTASYSGTTRDGELAVNVPLSGFGSIVFDPTGNLFIMGHPSGAAYLRKVDTNGIITTLNLFSLDELWPLVRDSQNNFYSASDSSNKIYRFVPGVTETVYAGTGEHAFLDEYRTSAKFHEPLGMAIDATGMIFIADKANNRVRKIDPSTGVVTTIAGTGIAGYNGTNIQSVSAQLYAPSDVAVDGTGCIYIADSMNAIIRKIDTNGILSTVAGIHGNPYSSGELIPAVSASVWPADLVAAASDGTLFLRGENYTIRMIDTNGIIRTVAGSGSAYVDNEMALTTDFGLIFDLEYFNGDLYVVDGWRGRVRRVLDVKTMPTVTPTPANTFTPSNTPTPTLTPTFTPIPTATPVVSNYYYSAGNRLERVETGNDVTLYEYDTMGQLIRTWKDADNDAVCDPGEEQKIFTWTITGELKQADVYRIEDATMQHCRVEYTYDQAGTGMLNTRVKSLVDGNAVTELKRSKYYWEGYDLYLEEEGDNSAYHTWEATYAYINQPSVICPVLARVDLGNNHQLDADELGNLTDSAYFYEYDEAGNVVLITDASGEIVTDTTGEPIHFEEDTWGNDLNNTFDKTNIKQHRTNKILDDVTGLYYCSARWYDPEIGRFISVSPLSPMGEEEYVYCYNDPVDYVDVDGLEPEISDIIGDKYDDLEEKFPGLIIPGLSPQRAGGLINGILGGAEVILLASLPGPDDLILFGKFFPYLTINNYRKYYIRFLGREIKSGYQVHHVFPQCFESDFKKIFGNNFNINSPFLLTEWEKASHLKFVNKYNQEIREFLKNGNITPNDMLKFMRRLAHKYNLNIHF